MFATRASTASSPPGDLISPDLNLSGFNSNYSHQSCYPGKNNLKYRMAGIRLASVGAFGLSTDIIFHIPSTSTFSKRQT
ncbi:hypothetical protein K443DRAFT_338713 [Laccaria amethystina LaAM-08-1]|uniref:Uncharacterized protein n=1 Tax=Laccaria amethystina LaAM-08-1 TaxID=1095629 RepID=A0A0C9WJQ5_9AGAR|nr:hypothetical protein K443DRAFT_338713 [Laccaria amethystina LaAM-08-1]